MVRQRTPADRNGFCADDAAKIRIFQRRARKARKVAGSRLVCVRIQPMRVFKMRPAQTKLRRAAVHLLGKCRDAAR